MLTRVAVGHESSIDIDALCSPNHNESRIPMFTICNASSRATKIEIITKCEYHSS